MLTIVGASGKLGFATLSCLLSLNLVKLSDIKVTSSSASGAAKLEPFVSKGMKLASASWDDSVEHWTSVFIGTDAIFLISSARIDKDFNNAPPGKGREADHFVSLEAAKAAGVQHVYYTSLAFANPSQSRVMKAHERTESYLKEHWAGKFTIIREGLYNESWPLYFGHYDLASDDRTEIMTCGDGPISWTSIGDLGLANALIISAPVENWAGRTLYLSQKRTLTLAEIAVLISRAKGSELTHKNVPLAEHELFYVRDRGMDQGMIAWWSETYAALADDECRISDPTLEDLLASKGVKPEQMEETVARMLQPAPDKKSR